MEPITIIMMVLFLSTFWGGFAFLLIKSIINDKKKNA